MYQQLLTKGRPTEWLDHAVLYVASVEYDVACSSSTTRAARRPRGTASGRAPTSSGASCCSNQRGHYECVKYGGLRVHCSLSKLEIVMRSTQLAAAHPEQLPMDNIHCSLSRQGRRKKSMLGHAALPLPPTVAAADSTDVAFHAVPSVNSSAISCQFCGDIQSAASLMVTPRTVGRKPSFKPTPLTPKA